ASVHSQSSPPWNTPALLQSTSTAPNVENAVEASASTSSNDVTSTLIPITSPPSSPTAVRSAWSSTSARTTCMPSAAQRRARLRPIPLAAPVTTAVFPSRSRTSVVEPEQHAGRLGERVVVDHQVLRRGVEVAEAALEHARAQGVGAGRGVGEAHCVGGHTR